jgi:hypothetical protein
LARAWHEVVSRVLTWDQRVRKLAHRFESGSEAGDGRVQPTSQPLDGVGGELSDAVVGFFEWESRRIKLAPNVRLLLWS